MVTRTPHINCGPLAGCWPYKGCGYTTPATTHYMHDRFGRLQLQTYYKSRCLHTNAPSIGINIILFLKHLCDIAVQPKRNLSEKKPGIYRIKTIAARISLFAGIPSRIITVQLTLIPGWPCEPMGVCGHDLERRRSNNVNVMVHACHGQ